MIKLKISHKLIIGFVIVASFSVVMGFFSFIQINKIARPLEKDIPESVRAIKVASHLDNLAQFIRYYDEVLTQSARNYAFTGDKKWEIQYNDIAPKLDEIISEAVTTGDKEEKNFFESISTANIALVEMEIQSITLVNNGKNKEAVSILESDLYRRQKQLYKDGLEKYVTQRGSFYNEVLQISTKTLDETIKNTRDLILRSGGWLFGISIFIFLFALSLSYVIARSILVPIQKLSKATQRITAGDFTKLIEINSNDEISDLANSFNQMAKEIISRNIELGKYSKGLEQRVQEKTKELSNQVTEVEKSKSAILNLLEDIEEEKKKVEGVVVLRTKELSEEKARLLASINSLSFGFVLADANDQIILKNPQLRKILDTTADIRSIHDIAQLFTTAGSKINIDIASSCKRCMELKAQVEFKEVSYGKKFLRIICAPVSSDKDTIGYIFLVEDITEAKVMERSRDEFFSIASHELRTPLTAIRGNADMILEMYRDKVVDKDMKDMLTDINTSSVRLIDIVNDFLEVSRLEQGKIEIKKETFALSDVVEKVVRDLKEMISKKGISLLYTPPTSPLPPVLADKNRVEQVLVNLVGNSNKFTTKGSIAIELTQVKNVIRVRVTDTGIGISDHNQTLLFRKFQQAGESTIARDVTQGTGLGLYISHLIMTTMGGEMGLEESQLGKGSVFFFTVPIAV